jgi:beta-glucuronidase
VPRPRRIVAALVLLVLLPASDASADTPRPGHLAQEGATGRHLLSGTWLFRRDARDRGQSGRWFRHTSARGWDRISVPHAWNAGDDSTESMAGSVSWYRRDFRLPRSGANDAWIVRFESVRYRATVWLNGRLVGRHEGAYLPWELRLRPDRRRTNRLVVRVDSRREQTDLPPSRVTLEGQPGGGWWNYGGILREVYLRRVRGVDLQNVQVRPSEVSPSSATIDFSADARSYSSRRIRVRVSARFGDRSVGLGSATLGPGRTRTVRGRLTLPSPRLWSPASPNLYPVRLTASGGGASGGYELMSGVRSLSVSGGRLLLNGSPVNWRGGFFHEDHPVTGAALTPDQIADIVRQAKDLGATFLRSHYSLSPYLEELADREGLLLWSEVPVYQVPSENLARSVMRRLARQMLETDIYASGNHPSVMAWSIGNELAPEPTGVEADYFSGMAALAHRLDPSRPVALALQGYPGPDCQAAYAPIDLLGLNTYFGWYPGPNGSTADRTLLSGYLDKIRACYPDKALANTELGAEANRSGPPEERGTYEFQQEWLDYSLGVYATKPWLSGATVMLREFRTRPAWDGGNPRPTPPFHTKGVYDFNGNPKPAASVVQRWFRQTQQYGLARDG